MAACLALALAATRRADAQALPIDLAPHRLSFDAARLVPTQLVYQTTLEQDTGTFVLGSRTVSVTPATYAGVPAWLLVETRSGDGIPSADSLYTTFLGLSPLHWSSAIGTARLAAEFRSDTVFAATSAPPGGRSIVAAIPAGAIVNGPMLETALRLLPLYGTWEDSTSLLSVSLGSNIVLPARLAVIGEDRVRVPAGTFDCWVVSVRADPARGLYWVTKQNPIVVRSAVDVPLLGTTQLVSALARIGR